MSVAFIVVALVVAGCATPVAEPQMRWAKEGASEADLQVDREACQQLAAETKAESKRFDHVAKGRAFLSCMTERGWRQVAVDS